MENEKKELIFVEGINFYKPRENAPKSIRGNVVIDMVKLTDWVAKQNLVGQVRIDLRKSEAKGTYYFTLNTWKPVPKEPERLIDPSDGRDITPNADDIVF